MVSLQACRGDAHYSIQVGLNCALTGPFPHAHKGGYSAPGRYPSFACWVFCTVCTSLSSPSYSNYDMQAERALSGEVERVEWVNPHIIIWVRVPDQEGRTAAARIEGHAPLMLTRNGFNSGDIKVGDQNSGDIPSAAQREWRKPGKLHSSG